MADKLTLKVTGDNKMRCGGCTGGVRFTLSQVPGVKSVNADHKTQLIEVEFGAELVKTHLLLEELDMLGYQVEVAA